MEPRDPEFEDFSSSERNIFQNAFTHMKTFFSDLFSFTDAEDKDEAFKDGAKKMQRDLLRRGLYSTGGGLFTPLPEPVNPQELKQTLTKAWDSLTTQHGPAALDDKEADVTSTYGQRRYDFMAHEEGVRRYAYKDNVGIPTIGIGFNLKANKQLFKDTLGVDDDYYDAIVDGHKGLTDSQVRKLFDVTIEIAENVIKRKINPDHPLTESQRLALVSLAFNGGAGLIGPKTTRHMQDGNWQGVIDEILWDSGSKKNAALRGRRWREAQMFAGADHNYTIPPIKAYKKWQTS